MDIINKTLSEVTKDEFVEIIMDKLTDYLSKEYQQFKPHIYPVKKVNGIKYGITLITAGQDVTGDYTVSPTAYIDDIYAEWSEKSIGTVLKEVAEILTQRIEISKAVLNLNNAKENIVFEVVNTEANLELLKKIPHKPFLDLSIIFRWVLDETMRASIVVTYELAEKMGLDVISLYDLAKNNTKRLMTPNVLPMRTVVAKILNVSEEEVKDADAGMWFVGNEKKIYGASSILYQDMLQELAEEKESDLFIIPSSIHELLVLLEADGHTADFISDMVNEVNMTQVEPEERLSNSVYFFSRETGKVSIAKASNVSIV